MFWEMALQRHSHYHLEKWRCKAISAITDSHLAFNQSTGRLIECGPVLAYIGLAQFVPQDPLCAPIGTGQGPCQVSDRSVLGEHRLLIRIDLCSHRSATDLT
jgi:hypothetical protein